jgi:hypothetical protein
VSKKPKKPKKSKRPKGQKSQKGQKGQKPHLHYFISWLNSSTLVSRRLELDLTDDVDPRGGRSLEPDSKIFVLGLPLGGRDVEAGRLEDDGVVDVSDESVGEVGELLTTIPSLRRSKVIIVSFFM